MTVLHWLSAGVLLASVGAAPAAVAVGADFMTRDRGAGE